MIHLSNKINQKIDELRQKRDEIRLGGGLKKQEAIRKTGRGTARDRIDMLLDEDSFIEIDSFVTHRTVDHNMFLHQTLGDGVVAGHGTIDGRRVYCFAQDFSVHGGSMGETHARKIAKVVEMAERAKVPIIGMWDGGGQRAHDGISGLAGTGELLDRLVQCSGRVPIISLVLGPVVGVSSLAASLADFTILGEEHGQLFLSSPLETPEVIQGEIDAAGLGGASLHASRSGIACLIADDDEDACEMASEILGFLPDHNMAEAPFVESADPVDRLNPELETLVPDNPNRPYDMVKVVEEIVDDGVFMQLFESYADNIIIGFARLGGRTVGVIGNQPKVLAGCLDIDASIKAARFIRTCDAFNVPLVTFEDVPGFLPGTNQEWGGIIRHGAKLLYAFAEATVPKLTVIMRKAYGGAYDVMSSKHIRGDYNVAWPSAELAVMGADGAVEIIHRRRLKNARNPEQERQRLTEDFNETFANPYKAAALGYIDDVIEPSETRNKLIRALEMLLDKEELRPARKHGNIPL